MTNPNEKCVMCTLALTIFEVLKNGVFYITQLFKETLKASYPLLCSLEPPAAKFFVDDLNSPPIFARKSHTGRSHQCSRRASFNIVTNLKYSGSCSHLALVNESSSGQIRKPNTARNTKAKSKIPILLSKKIVPDGNSTVTPSAQPSSEMYFSFSDDDELGQNTVVRVVSQNAPKKRPSLTVNPKKRRPNAHHNCHTRRSMVGSAVPLPTRNKKMP